MSKQFTIRVLVAMLLTAVLPWSQNASIGQAVPQVTEPHPYISPELDRKVRQEYADYYLWINAPWTDSDAPFAAARAEIDSAIKAGQRPVDLTNRYRADAQLNPQSPQAQFAYYYAAYKTASMPDGEKLLRPAETGGLYLAIARKDKFPHTYNFARLAFLCGAYDFPNQRLKDIGRRLLKRDPHDNDVKYRLATVLALSWDKAERAQAMQYAQQLFAENPNTLSSYALIARVRKSVWIRSHLPADAQAAISAYQEYLKLTPNPNDSDSQRAKLSIQFIQSKLAPG